MPDNHVLTRNAFAAKNADRQSVLLKWHLAVAEALHVDGHFAEAVEFWKEAWTDDPSGDVAFRTAVSLIAVGGNDTDALAWLNAAEADGFPRTAIDYVGAQRKILRGDLSEGYELLRVSGGASTESLTLLSMLDAQLGRRERAIKWTRAALAIDPDDCCALCNAVALGLFGERWWTALRRAANALPERAEPLLLAARKTEGDLQHMLSSAAALRAPSRLKRAARAAPVDARVAARLDRAKLEGRCHWHAPHGTVLPAEFLAHPSVTVSIEGRPDASPRLEGGTHRYSLSGAWGRTEQGHDLRFTVSLDADISATDEFEAPHAWLPVAASGAPMDWTMSVEPRDNLETLEAVDPAGLTAPAIIVFRNPAHIRGKWLDGIAGRQSIHLARAVAVADRAFPLWKELVGATTSPKRPVLAILDAPTSTVCFTRRNLIRVPLRIAADAAQIPVLIHEVGHLWWGAGVAFERDSRWLAEALAEFSLHLAEDRGIVEGYRRRTRAAIGALLEQRENGYDLVELAGSRSAESAYLLRAIGGFVISLLRETLGPERFAEWAALLIASDRPIIAYEAFALAGWLHGHSLNPFVNQWIAAAGFPTATVLASTVAGSAGRRMKLCCRMTGGTLAGVKLPVMLVFDGDAAPTIVFFDLALGEDSLAVDVSARLIDIVIDPDAKLPIISREKIEG